MLSNSAILAQAQGSNSRRQCKSQMCVCKSFAGHDHQHRSGRRHGNQAIQPEEGAQFPRRWVPNRHKRQREPVDPDSAIQRAVGVAYPRFPEAVMQARSQVQVRPKEDCITNTESFLERARKRVAGVRQEVEKARDAVTSAETKGIRQVEERLLRWRLKASCVPANPPNSRRFHAGIGTIRELSPAGKRRLAIRTNKSRQPRKRTWSPKEVAQIFVLTFSGSLDAPAEPRNHSWGKHPEPFIDDGDDHRSSKICRGLTRLAIWMSRVRVGIERPSKLVIRMPGESTLWSGDVDRTCWSWEPRTQFRKRVWMVVPPRTLRLTPSVKKKVWRWVLATLQALTNEDRRPAIPQDVIDFVPAVEFSLDDNLFFKTLRSARRGAACGPSGMTYEHLLPLLNYRSDFSWVNVSPGPQVPQPIVDAICMGRVTALRKRAGGVRRIVCSAVSWHGPPLSNWAS